MGNANSHMEEDRGRREGIRDDEDGEDDSGSDGTGSTSSTDSLGQIMRSDNDESDDD